MVGAHQDNDEGSNSGSAYIFGRDNGGAEQWGQEDKLTAFDGKNGDEFGYSVGIDDDKIIVGAPFDGDGNDDDDDDDSGNESARGSSYLFMDDGTGSWSLLEKIVTPEPTNNDQFATSVAFGGHTVAIGSPNDDGSSSDPGNAGAVFIYRVKYNNAPTPAVLIPDQYVVVNTALSFVVPENTFGDPDTGDFFTWSAQLSGGGALPGGVTFNPATREFSGSPTAVGDSTIEVSVADEDGLTAAATFDLKVVANAGGLPVIGGGGNNGNGNGNGNGGEGNGGSGGEGGLIIDEERRDLLAEAFGMTTASMPYVMVLEDLRILHVADNGDGNLLLSFNRRKDAPEYTYTLEMSPNGNDWQEVESASAEDVTSVDDIAEEVTLRVRCFGRRGVGNLAVPSQGGVALEEIPFCHPPDNPGQDSIFGWS